nr:MFS transporter [Streptomyces boncukensis]
MFALLGCAFLAMLDGTVLGTALPRIVEQVGGSDAWYVWLVTASLLTSSVSVPVYGRFSDLYGRRRLLLAGPALFLGGSLGCGLACAPSLTGRRPGAPETAEALGSTGAGGTRGSAPARPGGE